MTPLVHPGQFSDATTLPHMLKPLLATFVRATIDSDADSSQTRCAKDWMARLGMEIGMAPRRKEMNDQVRQSSIDIVKELLGGSRWSRVPEKEGSASDFKLFHTLYVGAATIALAARANGADINLHCVSKGAIRDIPDSAKCAFQVRFWICQPPSHIISLLIETVEEEVEDRNDPWRIFTDKNNRESNIIFGGEMEIALNIAQSIGYVTRKKEKDTIMRLWEAGLREGKALIWMSRPIQKSSDLYMSTPHAILQLRDTRPL